MEKIRRPAPTPIPMPMGAFSVAVQSSTSSPEGSARSLETVREPMPESSITVSTTSSIVSLSSTRAMKVGASPGIVKSSKRRPVGSLNMTKSPVKFRTTSSRMSKPMTPLAASMPPMIRRKAVWSFPSTIPRIQSTIPPMSRDTTVAVVAEAGTSRSSEASAAPKKPRKSPMSVSWPYGTTNSQPASSPSPRVAAPYIHSSEETACAARASIPSKGPSARSHWLQTGFRLTATSRAQARRRAATGGSASGPAGSGDARRSRLDMAIARAASVLSAEKAIA